MLNGRPVTPEFAEKLDTALTAYRAFAAGQQATSCRLVHYVGAGKPSAIDIAVTEIEGRIFGCITEGFSVGWFAEGVVTYLWVQEPDCPKPSHANVVAEEALVDVDALLKSAGL